MENTSVESRQYLHVNHTQEADQIQIPSKATPPKAARAVTDWAEDQAKEYKKQQKFTHRPWDGAAAFNRAMMRVFGTHGSGMMTGGGFFSPANPPQLISVDEQVLIYSDRLGNKVNEHLLLNKEKFSIVKLVKYAGDLGIAVPSPFSEEDRLNIVSALIKQFEVVGTYVGTIQVPWGAVEIPDLGLAELSGTMDEDYGPSFHLSVTAPKSKTEKVQALFAVIEDELKHRSVYKGRAIDSAGDNPRFYDPFVIDRNSIIYAEELEHQVEKLMLNPIKYTEKARSKRLLKRQHLLTGDYGTGKSLTMLYAAQVALKNGWTVIRYNPLKDKLDSVFKLARMYQPAIVLAEDADAFSDVSNPQSVSELLDAFDGMLAKGGEITTIMTTNHPSSITKGMLRPGRIDSLIMFTPLDRPGVEKLYKLKVDEIDQAVDFDNVYGANEGYSPAFVAESINRVNVYGLDKDDTEAVSEEDLIFAAQSLRPQNDLHNAADEASRVVPTMDSVMRQQVEVVLDDYIVSSDDWDAALVKRSRA